MKICLVTAFPPSRQALNEYGFHVARELSQTDGLSLTVLGDDIAPDEEELPGYSVIRCWSFNSLRNPVRLLRTIRQVQPDVGAYASVPQHHPEEIWPRGCLRQKSRNSHRQARISGVCATRESRASDFGFRKMGHVQAARADAQGFRDRRARCAEYPVDHRGNRSSEDARISRINSTEMLAPPANQIHGLCSRRADSRTVSEHNGDGDALHLVRWVQRRSTFGLRLWCTDGGFRYFRLS